MAVKSLFTIVHESRTTQYLCTPKHRGRPKGNISVWTIDRSSEIGCFTICFRNDWIVDSVGWGVIPLENQNLSVLGINLQSGELLIAKFIADQNVWHGYPADIRYKANDKPVPHILLNWYQNNLISKSFMSRVKQGKI